MKPLNKSIAVIRLVLMAMLLTSCVGNKSTPDDHLGSSTPIRSSSLDIEGINKQLNLVHSSSQSRAARAYRIGSGDVLDVFIFQVDELSKKYGVNSSGTIIVPLLGAVDVLGLTVEKTQELLTQKLGQTLLKNPQVNVSVVEYSSQQITVMGAVKKPNIYTIKHGVNVYEMLTMAGGLANDAGKNLYIKTTQIDPISGELAFINKTIDIKEELFNPDSFQDAETQTTLRQLILGNGDSLLIEQAGVVFVDGPIKKPGKYAITGDSTVLQILAEAGGGEFVASESKIRILRENKDKTVRVINVNAKNIRENKEPDIALADKDVITIGENAFKVAFKGFFDYVLRLWFLF